MLHIHNFLLMTGFMLWCSSFTQAQTMQSQDTDWLKNQLNELVDREEASPVFDFKECRMMMNLDSKEEGIRVRVAMNWSLKDIKQVSYKPATPGIYTLLLDIPANKIKGKVKVGIFSKSLRNKEDGGHSSFDLTTQDEKLVEAIQHKFEAIIKTCQSEKK